MFSDDWGWSLIEERVQSICESAPKAVRKEVMPGCYLGGTWRVTTLAAEKTPCVVCSKMPAQMAVLRATLNQKWVEPLALCPEHRKAWKLDERTQNRLTEEKRREHDRRVSLTSPRGPADWQIDVEKTVSDINLRLDSLRLAVPDIANLPEQEALNRMKIINRLKTLLRELEQTAQELK